MSTTISNQLSSLRTYFGMAGLNKAPLMSPVVANAMRAISLTVRHVPRPAAGITPEIIARALAHAYKLDYPTHTRLAIIWMFMAFLRQSNIAPRTTTSFDPTRHLTRGDIDHKGDHLIISLKWSKTMQKSQTATTVSVWGKPGSSTCPVAAYNELLTVAPTATSDQPLLQFRDGNPMTTPYVARSWSRLLQEANISEKGLTLHGLRRGGASYSYHQEGAKLEDVMSHGKWASSAVRAYLTPQRAQKTSVHRALATIHT